MSLLNFYSWMGIYNAWFRGSFYMVWRLNYIIRFVEKKKTKLPSSNNGVSG